MVENLDQTIQKRLSEARNILVVSHIRPDGDAIGSLLAMGLALQNAGKTVQMVLEDGMPSSFRYLDGAELVKNNVDESFDTFIVVDCSDFKRAGKTIQKYGPPDINIDHHKTNENFGQLNLVETKEVATATVLTRHLPIWGYEITQSVAAALLTGIITDTLGFRTSNMTPDTMRQVASLMETGADMPEIYMRGLIRRPFAAARYWGAGLSKLERSDGLVWGTLTLEDRQACGYNGNDDADLINVISAIDESKVGMIFVEQHGNRVKISWRALERGIDVSSVAKYFGGGGHAAAAGADIPGAMNEVQPLVLKTTREMLELG